MAEIIDKDSLERWMRSATRESAVALANRAALRALPLIYLPINSIDRPSDWNDAVTLQIFRALYFSMAAERSPPAPMLTLAVLATKSANSAVSRITKIENESGKKIAALPVAFAAKSAVEAAASKVSRAVAARATRSIVAAVAATDGKWICVSDDAEELTRRHDLEGGAALE